MSEEQKQPKMNMPRFNMNWLYVVIIAILAFLFMTEGGSQSSIKTTTSYSQFKTMVLKGYANRIIVNNDEKTLKMYGHRPFCRGGIRFGGQPGDVYQ